MKEGFSLHVLLFVLQMFKAWKSHATLTLLAKQECPLWLQYD